MRIGYFKEFLVLAEHLNFSIASELLNMTQPGLSRHISTLETELGIKLFKRDTHTVELTQAGIVFRDGVKKIVDDYEFLCEKVLDAESGQLHIGIPYFGIKKYISDMIGGFEAAHPNVKLKYMPAYPESIVDALLAKKLDLAIMPRVDASNLKKLIFQDAFQEPLAVMMHRDHPLASRESVSLGDLKNERFLYIEGPFAREMIEYRHEMFRKAGFDPEVELIGNTIEEAALKMKPDMGVMITPGHVKEANLSAHIKIIDLADARCFLTISLCHHQENKNPLIKPFVDYYLKLTAKGAFN